MARKNDYSTYDNARYLEAARILTNGPNRCLWRVAGPEMSDGGSILEAWWTRHGVVLLHAHGAGDHAGVATMWEKGIGETFDEMRSLFDYDGAGADAGRVV